jgi:hypothetical protein
MTVPQLNKWLPSILNGEFQTEADIPEHLRNQLSSEEAKLVVEKSLQVLGLPGIIIESTADLSFYLNNNKMNKSPITCERLFLRGFAFSRLGQFIECRESWNSFVPTKPQSIRMKIESHVTESGRGEFQLAAVGLNQIWSDHKEELDPYSLATLLGAWCLSSIHIGNYLDAKNALKQ